MSTRPAVEKLLLPVKSGVITHHLLLSVAASDMSTALLFAEVVF